MTRSTAYEPVPAALSAQAAESYTYRGGRYTRRPFVFDKLVPDGSISTTAADMARFMSAQLQHGRLGDAQILLSATADLMHRHSFSADERLDGYAHGFQERTLNGHRVITHDGSWQGFQSLLILAPDSSTGLFVSTNSIGGIDAVTTLLDDYVDRFMPGTRQPPVPTAGTAAAGRSAPDLSGFYRPARENRSTVEKLLQLTNSSRARVDADGPLRFAGRHWTPIGPLLYQNERGARLAVLTGPDGRVRYLATEGPTYERVPAAQTPPVNLAALLVFAALGVTAAVGAPVTALVRRLRRTPAAPSGWRRARRLTVLTGVLGIAFLVLLGLTLAGDTSATLYGPTVSLRALLLLPMAFTVLTAAATVSTARHWRGGAGVLVRTHQLLLIAGLLVLVGFCVQWNLLGWRFG